MIPRIQTGTSFAGAGLYYLHDKRRDGESERLTDERVAWTYAINTMEQDPEAVLAEMRQTAFDQPLLKQLSGNRLDGRPTERTVMTVALAWSPEQAPPTKEHMIETGHSFLQFMKWEAHQVLFVSHNDTKHPHVHLIINRVHPETGMTMDDKWYKTNAQRWALKYEREHGQIFCHAREARYDRDQERDAPHMNYREWQTWQAIAKENAHDPEFRQALEAGEWDALKQGQKQERMGFWKETGRMRQDLRATLRENVREEFAGEWHAYALEKAERLEKARAYDREVRRALRHLRRGHGANAGQRVRKDDVLHRLKSRDAQTVWIGDQSAHSIEQIKERQKAYHDRMREDLAKMRADISSRQKACFEKLAAPALDKFIKDRFAAFDEVKARHRQEKAGLRDDQAQDVRRPDVLQGYGKTSQATPLTATQFEAYLRQAHETAARRSEFEQARGETTRADHARRSEPGRDEQQATRGREMTERRAAAASRNQEVTERKAKDLAHAKRIAAVNEMLADRKFDRERGGGRTRDR
jgi:Relaxase/Mobilisation nuclease domain